MGNVCIQDRRTRDWVFSLVWIDREESTCEHEVVSFQSKTEKHINSKFNKDKFL